MINEFGTDYQTTNPEKGRNNAEAKKNSERSALTACCNNFFASNYSWS